MTDPRDNSQDEITNVANSSGMVAIPEEDKISLIATPISTTIRRRIERENFIREQEAPFIQEKLEAVEESLKYLYTTGYKNPALIEALKERDALRAELIPVTFNANDNISNFIEDGELDKLQEELELKMQGVLESLVIDTHSDHNTKDTAKRVAKMYLKELYNGRYAPEPSITEFPNAKNHDELCTLGPIDIKATCSHHMVPIVGNAWIGFIPGEKVIGLSKFNRITTWIMGRPHIQEEAVELLADKIEELIKPKGLAVVIQANHMCMTLRGVHAKQESSMITSVIRGAIKDSPATRQEFYNLIKAQGFK